MFPTVACTLLLFIWPFHSVEHLDVLYFTPISIVFFINIMALGVVTPVLLTIGLLVTSVSSAASQTYTWNNVKTGGQCLCIFFVRGNLADRIWNVFITGGGGFTPGIVFNPSAQGVAYARTDIGGPYRLNEDDTWTPLLDSVNNSNW
jgi:xyloglucan-specific exo-beta-1,4-glucanase